MREMRLTVYYYNCTSHGTNTRYLRLAKEDAIQDMLIHLEKFSTLPTSYGPCDLIIDKKYILAYDLSEND